MTKNTKIALVIFTAIVGLLIANAFAPYELRNYNFCNDNEQAFFTIDGVKQRLEIGYQTGYDTDNKNLLFGFGGYEAFTPSNHGSVAITYDSLEDKVKSVKITTMQITIDGKKYELPIPNEAFEFKIFSDANVDKRPYVYVPLNTPVIPQKTADLYLTGIITDRNGKTANFEYQSKGHIEITVETIPHWHNFFRILIA